MNTNEIVTKMEEYTKDEQLHYEYIDECSAWNSDVFMDRIRELAKVKEGD